jgi:hypothetical protein
LSYIPSPNGLKYSYIKQYFQIFVGGLMLKKYNFIILIGQGRIKRMNIDWNKVPA